MKRLDWGYFRNIADRKRVDIRLARLNDCFLRFGASPEENINRLVALCGELMNAACALYNRLGKNLLSSVGQWRTPADFKPEDEPQGHLCYDVIRQGGEHPLLVRNLQESPYAETDPNVLSYGLQTYVGVAVKWEQAVVGSLCVVYQTDITPSKDDLQFMEIVASAIAIEEDRQRAEEALSRSEENFRRSLEESPLGMRIVTNDGDTLYANRAMLAIFGCDSLEEYKAIPAVNRYTPESYAAFLIRREKRERGDDSPSEFEIDIIRKDGEVRQLLVFRKETFWDGQKQSQILYNDVTPRKRAEAALRQSENRYQELFENMGSGVAVFEPRDNGEDFVFKEYNVAAEMLEKTPRAEVINRSVVDVFPGVKAFGLFDVFQRVYKTGKSERYPLTFYRDRKISRWMEHYVYKLPTGEIVTVYEDTTERKRAEEELRASRSQLRALAARLQQIREEERLLIAREIHDEMGGGLTGLKMDLSWLMRRATNRESTAGQAAVVSKIRASNELIDQMIQVVRRISTDLRPSVLDDLGLVAALEWQLAEFSRRTGILHEFSATSKHLNIEKETVVAVFRIFQEALTNVMRHSRATKIAVVLREGEEDLFGDRHFVLEIRDNGRGITEEEILNLKSLGLLGMKERVLAVGGSLSIRGEPGGGTNLVVQIPRRKGEGS